MKELVMGFGAIIITELGLACVLALFYGIDLFYGMIKGSILIKDIQEFLKSKKKQKKEKIKEEDIL